MAQRVSFGQYPSWIQFLIDYAGSFLTEESKALLEEKKGILNKELKSNVRGEKNWSFNIPQSRPLTFVDCEEKKVRLIIDVALDIQGTYSSSGNKEVKVKNHNINVRIWSLDKNISYREEYDAESMVPKLEQNEWKRVMVRFHIDKKIQDEEKKRCLEPIYHLHFGGRAEECELAWYCEKFEEPRFIFFPLDLILLTELVLANYFPNKSKKLREEPQWKRLVQKSQEIFIRPYLDILHSFLNDNDNTMLGHLITAEDI